MRILLVEDDLMIGEVVLDALRDAHYAVDWVRDGTMADTALATQSYDLVLLDLGLPHMSGLDVLRALRSRRSTTPVLVATARDAVTDRVAGLDAGADDYIVKPYDLDELQARIRALLRRSAGQAQPWFEQHGVRLNPATHEAEINGQPVSLSAREWAVLEPLIARPGVVFSRAQLEDKLYSWKSDISSNAVEVYVHGLRKKLGAGLIQTVRGLGYVVPRDSEMSSNAAPAATAPRHFCGAASVKDQTTRPVRRPRAKPLQSLRGRLTILLLGVIFLAAVAQGISAYRTAQNQADALLDAHLQQMADALRGGATRNLAPAPSSPASSSLSEEERALSDLLVQIWGNDGAQLFRSPNADLPRHAVLGFSDITVEGNRYRVYSLQTPLQTIQIAQDMTARQQRAQAIAWQAVWPIAAAAPLLMLAVWCVIGTSLRPVERARRQLSQRQANDLSPVDEQDLPSEVQPLVHELNSLFSRVQAAFQAQKSFVADAAHELRSPLAALKLQTQTLKTDPADASQQRAVHRLEQGIARATNLLDQLLLLARVEAGNPTQSSPATSSPCDVQRVLRLAVADVLPLASHRRIDISVDDSALTSSTPPILFPDTSATPQALHALLRNLLENAAKYSPEGGRVVITLNTEGQSEQGRKVRPIVIIDDNGPGIAPAERERVFDRFYRSPDLATAAPGSGLGLAIVKTIAQHEGIDIELGEAPPLSAPHDGTNPLSSSNGDISIAGSMTGDAANSANQHMPTHCGLRVTITLPATA